MTRIPVTTPQAAAARQLVEVRQVKSRQDRLQFVRFPWQIFRSDPYWVPPLEIERLEFINPRLHPFYLHGEAAQFLAWRDGQIVGRIQASNDPLHSAGNAANQGAFGLFESIEDQSVADALLDTAAAWLADRGRTAMLGPIDYSTNYACGLLVDGFETPPRVMMNHNPRYYAGLLETYGLEKAKDLFSWWFDDPHDMIQKWRRRADRLAERGIVIRTFGRREIEAEVMRCRNIYNEAWQQHWGFVQMTDAEFHYYGKFLAEWGVPELLLLAEVEGKPVGFSMTLPDFNEAFRGLNGRLTRWGLPLGYLQFRQNLKRIRTARLVTFGILDQYRRRGISELMILRTLDYGKNVLGYTGAELGWTLEDNDAINRPIATVGGQKYKTYRIYEKAIG